jgi:uncharacterized protein (TIGR04255 family)
LTINGLQMNWEPAHADHSIDRVVATLSFANAFDPNTFDELVVSARKVVASYKLTNRLDQQEPIQFTPGAAILSPSTFRRVLFQRIEAPNVVVEEFAIGQQRVAFGTTRYRRWEHLRRLITDTLTGLEQVSPILAGTQSLKLEYYDRFQALSADADLFEVIDKSSVYLSPVLQSKTTALHVHTGWFDYESGNQRRLTNINIDANDAASVPAGGSKFVTILSLGQLDALGGMLADPLLALDGLHDYLKDLVRATITPEAAVRVGLAE